MEEVDNKVLKEKTDVRRKKKTPHSHGYFSISKLILRIEYEGMFSGEIM